MLSQLKKHAAASAALRRAHLQEMEKAAFLAPVKNLALGAGRVLTAPLRAAGSVAALPVKAGLQTAGALGRGAVGVAAKSPLKTLVGGLTLAGGAAELQKSRAGFRTAANIGQNLTGMP